MRDDSNVVDIGILVRAAHLASEADHDGASGRIDLVIRGVPGVFRVDVAPETIDFGPAGSPVVGNVAAQAIRANAVDRSAR